MLLNTFNIFLTKIKNNKKITNISTLLCLILSIVYFIFFILHLLDGDSNKILVITFVDTITFFIIANTLFFETYNLYLIILGTYFLRITTNTSSIEFKYNIFSKNDSFFQIIIYFIFFMGVIQILSSSYFLIKQQIKK